MDLKAGGARGGVGADAAAAAAAADSEGAGPLGAARAAAGEARDRGVRWYSHGLDGPWVFKLLYHGANGLPRWFVGACIYFFGTLFFFLLRRDRRHLVDNMAHVLGVGQSGRWRARWLAYRNCLNFSRFLVEVQRVWKNGVALDDFSHEGTDLIRRALDEGRGAILLTAHMGNWEVGTKAVATQGYRVNIVVMEPVNQAVQQFLWRMRSTPNVGIIPVNDSLYSTVGILRALKRNELVGIQGDRPIGENSLPVDFFGAPARLPIGPIRIAMVSGAPLVPCFILRAPGGKHRVQVEPPILIDGDRDSPADLARNLGRVARVFEKVIRAHPEQWFCFFPVWKDEGPGVRDAPPA